MKILLLVVPCLILYVYAQQEQATVDEFNPIETEYFEDDDIALERALAAKKFCPYACKCGIPNFNNNGTSPVKNRVPFAAIISSVVNNTRRFICGGAVINSLYVLTTRSCVQNYDPKNLTISIARYSSPEFRGFNRNVDVIKPHPYANVDMALVKFDRAISFNNNDIRPICLPTPTRALDGQRGVTATWARVGGGAIRRSPAGVYVNMITNAACKPNRSNITSFDVCASSTAGGNSTFCQSDRGGPLSVIDTVMFNGVQRNQFTLAGLASLGFGCNSSTTVPAVYTRVPPVLYYIYTNSTDGCTCAN